MTKKHALSIAALVFAVIGSVAFSVSVGAAAPTSATGAGTLTILGELRNFAFTASTNKDITKGQAQLNNRDQDAIDHIDIDCMRVVGNQAVISGVITKSNTGQEGNTGVFTVEDNGEGKNASPDRLSLVFFYAPQPPGTLCTVFPFASFPTSPIEGGNIQVH